MIIHAGGRDLAGSEKAEGEEYGSDFEVAAAQSQIVKGDTDIN